MSLSRQNLSIVIVTFKSESVIHDCIRSIGNDIDIIVVDNSNNLEFKERIEEVARMLSGEKITDAARNAAESLFLNNKNL